MTASRRESVVHGSQARPQDLPAVDRLLRAPAVAALVAEHGATLVTAKLRALLARWRAEAVAGRLPAQRLDSDAVGDAAAQELAADIGQALAPRPHPMLNLTGTVVHTNLGRSVLAPAARAALADTMGLPLDLEYDRVHGGRGDRDVLVEPLLCALTGAEAATVVNNNAAAVLLVLAALGGGREAIVSRGELVEIGGAFRMPDVMAAAGVRLVEVGTTNRTHRADYERAIGPATALLQKVHPSNFEVQGFTASVPEDELAALAHAHGLPLVSDLGSGALVDLGAWGLPPEPTPQRMLAAGCDVVTFSGDKLLGGPQAGIIVGGRTWIDRIRRHPLKRALRLSKLPLVALEATLRLYLRPERLTQDLPTLRWLARSADAVRQQAEALLPEAAALLGERFAVRAAPMSSQVGSGARPADRLASWGLVIEPRDGRDRTLQALAAALRRSRPAVVGRIESGAIHWDLRCLDDDGALQGDAPQALLRDALAQAVQSLSEPDA